MVSGAILPHLSSHLQQPQDLLMPFSGCVPVLTILFVGLVIFPQNKLQQEHEDAKVLFY